MTDTQDDMFPWKCRKCGNEGEFVLESGHFCLERDLELACERCGEAVPESVLKLLDVAYHKSVTVTN